MISNLTIIILGIAIAIGIIVIIAYGLQEWLVEKRFSAGVVRLPDKPLDPKYLEFSEKLRVHLEIIVPIYEIKLMLPVSNSDDEIVLLKQIRMFPNLFRCRSDSSHVWQAELPEKSGDVYTHAEMKNQEFIADRWLCFRSRSRYFVRQNPFI